MEEITIDGLEENEFRRSIEALLRNGQAESAAERLLPLVASYTGAEKMLPARFLTVRPEDIHLSGWAHICEKIGEFDRPDHEISALGIDLSEVAEQPSRADEVGNLRPGVQISYFSDSAYPFTDADRDDLLEGYSMFGCEWQGNQERTDPTLTIEGIDDLYGAVAKLEDAVSQAEEPDIEQIRAGSVGACYLAVLIHLAVREAIKRNGLPRAMCVMAGSEDIYPYFDAPVMSSAEYVDSGLVKPLAAHQPRTEFADDAEPRVLESVENMDEYSADPGGYQSLLTVRTAKPSKKMALVVEPDEAAANIQHLVTADHFAHASGPAGIGVLAGSNDFAADLGGGRSEGDADRTPSQPVQISELEIPPIDLPSPDLGGLSAENDELETALDKPEHHDLVPSSPDRDDLPMEPEKPQTVQETEASPEADPPFLQPEREDIAWPARPDEDAGRLIYEGLDDDLMVRHGTSSPRSANAHLSAFMEPAAPGLDKPSRASPVHEKRGHGIRARISHNQAEQNAPVNRVGALWRWFIKLITRS